MTDLKTQINENIDTLVKSERVTKAALSALSRQLLEYVVLSASNDIDMVNRTLAACTPMNRQLACHYFREYLPFEFDDKGGTFGKMVKRQLDDKCEAIRSWLSEEDNDLWKYQELRGLNVKKPTNWADKIKNDVKKALADKENGLTVDQVVACVLQGGVDVADIMAVAERVIEIQTNPDVLAAMADQTVTQLQAMN